MIHRSGLAPLTARRDWPILKNKGLSFRTARLPRIEGTRIVEQITSDHFHQVDLRIGRVVDVRDFPTARKPAYKLWIDFGELGVKQSSAQITRLYRKEDLLGRLIVAVTNLPPRPVADFQSEVLILGVETGDGGVVLLQPEREVPVGLKVS